MRAPPATRLQTKRYEVRLRAAVSHALSMEGWKTVHGTGVEFRTKPTRPRGSYGRWQRFFVAESTEKDLRPVLEELIDKYLESKKTP